MNLRCTTILPVLLLGAVDLASLHAAATFTPLGDLPGGSFNSHASGVSSDGRVVVGRSIDGEGVDEWQAFRWTAETGMVALGHSPGTGYSSAEDASGDGSVIVGTSGTADNSVAFRWTAETGMAPLPAPPGYGAVAVSDDGKVIVGPFRMWTESEGARDLPFNATAVSPDGSVVVGGHFGLSFGVTPVRWTASEGVVRLSHGIEDNIEPTGVSAEGAVIAMNIRSGYGSNTSRWTQHTGIVPLTNRGIYHRHIRRRQRHRGRWILDRKHGIRELARLAHLARLRI